MAALGVFAKPPLPGLVKTRLIPTIGALAAARIYRHCLKYTLELARESGLDYRLFLSQPADDELFESGSYTLQQGSDLGARMLNAMRDMLGSHDGGVIIIGSDCLDLSVAHLQAAAQALGEHELVLLPALDGGYALIGCTAPDPLLFERVDWGSGRVLQQTLANSESLGYRVSLLETVRDIDTLQDLEQYPELVALIHSA